MCGIAGILRLDDAKIDRELLGRMSDAVTHRGPDGSGIFVEGPIGLAHRRLAIIDLSDHAAQPMHYMDRYVITYNGEIYNYIELRNELKAKGHCFHSDGDAEVILAAYAEWGSACVERFNGMWAFAIFDRAEKIVFASRDRFGIKPFYFIHNEKFMAFGSEIKQLVPLLPSVRANSNVLADFMVLGLSQHTNETFFESIQKLPQSHSITFRLDGTQAEKRYFQLAPQDGRTNLNPEQAVEQFQELLTDSIRLRLRSDVKVGACLSGGLDSSTICAIATRMNPEMTGITATSNERENDESAWADIVARKCALDWHTISADESDFLEQTHALANIQEEPFPTPSIYLQYRVFEAASALGCKVMLDGQGGDETLLGYERYYAAHLLSLRGMARIRGIAEASRNSKLSLLDVVRYAAYFLSPKVRRRVLTQRAEKYLNESAIATADWRWIDCLADWYRDTSRMQIGEISQVQLPSLLMYEDKNSMCHSVESRLPYLDYRLVEFAVALAQDYKIREGWSKWVLRRTAEQHLPSEIAWRTNKIGFAAPSSTLLANNQDLMEDAIRNSRIWQGWHKDGVSPDMLANSEIWKLYFVARWEEAYGVSL